MSPETHKPRILRCFPAIPVIFWPDLVWEKPAKAQIPCGKTIQKAQNSTTVTRIVALKRTNLVFCGVFPQFRSYFGQILSGRSQQKPRIRPGRPPKGLEFDNCHEDCGPEMYKPRIFPCFRQHQGPSKRTNRLKARRARDRAQRAQGLGYLLSNSISAYARDQAWSQKRTSSRLWCHVRASCPLFRGRHATRVRKRVAKVARSALAAAASRAAALRPQFRV